MALRALKIVDDSFADLKKSLDGKAPTQVDIDQLHLLIADRITSECIEIPDCRFCGKPEVDCNGSGMDDGIQAHDFTPN